MSIMRRSMANCLKCGAQIADGAMFCPNWGAPVEQQAQGQPNDPQYQQAQGQPNDGQYQQAQGQQNDAQYQQAQGQQYNGQYQQNQGQQYNGQYQQDGNYYSGQPVSSGFSSHGAAMLCYWFGIVGWLISYCAGNNKDPYLKFHLNQSLVIFLFSLVGWIPYVGWIWSIFLFVCTIMGFIGACQDETKEIPLLGKIYILK